MNQHPFRFTDLHDRFDVNGLIPSDQPIRLCVVANIGFVEVVGLNVFGGVQNTVALKHRIVCNAVVTPWLTHLIIASGQLDLTFKNPCILRMGVGEQNRLTAFHIVT